jgi:hypothetical protein
MEFIVSIIHETFTSVTLIDVYKIAMQNLFFTVAKPIKIPDLQRVLEKKG